MKPKIQVALFCFIFRYDMIPCSLFLMLIQSNINTERKLPNISEKYRFRKFELSKFEENLAVPDTSNNRGSTVW